MDEVRYEVRDLTTEETIAWVLDPRNDNGTRDAIYVMAQNYDPNGEPGEWDGLTSDDYDTFAEDIETGDTSGFGEWGPFQLWFPVGKDPVAPRELTPAEAVERIASFLGVFEDHSYTLDLAIDVLDKFVQQVNQHGSTDLEWGNPGDCWERIENDPDIRDELRLIPPTDDEGYWATHDRRDEEQKLAVEKGLGRHYGDPHCIWCLQAS